MQEHTVWPCLINARRGRADGLVEIKLARGGLTKRILGRKQAEGKEGAAFPGCHGHLFSVEQGGLWIASKGSWRSLLGLPELGDDLKGQKQAEGSLRPYTKTDTERLSTM